MSEKASFTITIEVGQVLEKIAELVARFVGGVAAPVVGGLPRKPGESPLSHLDRSVLPETMKASFRNKEFLVEKGETPGIAQTEDTTTGTITKVVVDGKEFDVSGEPGGPARSYGDKDFSGTGTATTVELDKNGLPWDVRIHVSTKTQKMTGDWKRKPGVATELVAKVEAELRQLMAIPAAPPETEAEKAFGAQETTEQTPPPPPPASSDSAPPASSDSVPPATTGTITTFAQLFQAITAGGIDAAVVTAACEKHGVPGLPLLGSREDLIPLVAAELFPGA